MSTSGARHEEYEGELHRALAGGVLEHAQVDALREEARRLERSPLELLLERGLVSPETLSELRGRPVTPPIEAPSTQRPGVRAEPSPHEPAFPLPHWERYQAVRFLGQGGMGQVFLAYDPRLRRNVALKFVRDGVPELAQRFLAEARAQARVHHAHVCEMYEVGEVQGRAFIAMRYVNGQHLGQLAPTLTLEQKLELLRQVAEGVHAAHLAGLIHRDLKPSNILVERAGNGTLKPYVMDFGLAREWSEEHTATGSVLGTPHYMAPEQARGEGSRLDGRVDVYSLGATLYQVLTGLPPFAGPNALELLTRIQTEEPRAPRAHVPTLPLDVEAITLKCLEKERSARYDSAHALAEDLGRFLSGEPVLARRAGPGYRLRKRLRKHWLLVGLSSTALLGVALAVGQAAWSRHEVAVREGLARRFTERVERLEAQARYSALAPLHDTRPDRTALREEMKALEADIREAGTPAEGPGHYALGRALLALDDAGGARSHLEAAWRGGYREARVAYALALALGRLYQEHLLEVESVRDPAQHEARARELERRYRDPALEALRQGAGGGAPSPHYVAALLAFYEGRYEPALSELDGMGATAPWFYEAPLLRGDIFRARSSQHRLKGERAAALTDLDAARQAYTTAAAIGESAPEVHQALGSLHLGALALELYGPGEVQPHYDRGLEALGHALTAAPDSARSLYLKSYLHRLLAESRLQTQAGGEVMPVLEQALGAARAALALAPEQPLLHWELAQDLRLWARYRQAHGEDPREPLRQAIEVFESVAPEERDYTLRTELGHSFKVWADYEDQVGGDSRAHRDRALESYRAATTLDPGVASGWVNLGMAYFKRATSARAEHADEDLEQAREALERARGLDAGNYVTCYYGAQVHEWRARRAYNRGEPAEPELERALALYRQGVAINARLPALHNALGGALLWRAELAWDEGHDAFPSLDEAQAAFERARALAPQQGYADNNLGEARALRAVWLRRAGEDPGPSAHAALEDYARAVERLPREFQLRVNQAKVHHQLALWSLEHGQDPGAELERATSALRQALELNPRSASALRYQGEVEDVRARWRARRGQARGEDFEQATRSFEQALALDSEWQEYRLSEALSQREWGAWLAHTGGEPGPVLQRGLLRIDEALKARPRWALAQVARAHLLLTLAETASAPLAQRGQWRDEARGLLKQALVHNPHLEVEWGPLLGPR